MTSTWNKALDVAGVHDRRLRADYTRQRDLVARFRRHAYVAVRLLLPGATVPHVIAMTAFMHHTDNVLDSGSTLAERTSAYVTWERDVREALAGGRADHPVIRPVLHTVAARPGLAEAVEAFLKTAVADLDFTGFATEGAYQDYVDAYSLPAFMLVAGVLDPGTDPGAYRAACRSYIDGSQRLDFVNDLAEDLEGGRLALPRETLEQHGVSRGDLESARETPAVRALLAGQLRRARHDLLAARRLAGLTSPVDRSFVRAMVELEVLTADAAAAKGFGLLRGPARPPAGAALRMFLRECARARTARRRAL
ncbi:phytoene/squalene synthetase [Streptomyces rectiverticillatus]|uniref:phytoene/squalene synthase family protein n=1 Tax=Streptomyces rectiverticillatus TaxID=173860 RepID=UPI0015C2F9B9|nr:squalene/phytoene synthase family protein [Streptomyces rectiverticillatus]QLE70855.1 phytoene/squalene synthetase [Streptomyces rectiverticillatus]